MQERKKLHRERNDRRRLPPIWSTRCCDLQGIHHTLGDEDGQPVRVSSTTASAEFCICSNMAAAAVTLGVKRISAYGRSSGIKQAVRGLGTWEKRGDAKAWENDDECACTSRVQPRSIQKSLDWALSNLSRRSRQINGQSSLDSLMLGPLDL
jgi:hypothetical protein